MHNIAHQICIQMYQVTKMVQSHNQVCFFGIPYWNKLLTTYC